MPATISPDPTPRTKFCAECDLLARQAAERKLAEQHYEESEAKFRAAAESAAVGVFILQGERLRYVNPALAAITGYAAKELLSMRFLDIVHPEFHELVRYRAQNPSGAYETKVLARAGEERWLEVGSRLIRFDGEPAVLGTAVDISARKRAAEERRLLEERLRQADKLECVGRLAAGVAHDFNNLLTAILGNATLAAEDLPPGHAARARLADVTAAAGQAAGLVRQLLAYAGKARFVVRPLRLAAVVRRIASLLRTSFAKGVRVHVDVPEDLPAIEADAPQIQQLVMNLAINAAEAVGGQPGEIWLKAGTEEWRDVPHAPCGLPPGRYVYLEVRDTGPGMDEETKARIFDPFFTTKFSGRGLGLAAAHGIVRGHRGAILVESAPGKGSAFRVLLPVPGGTPQPPAAGQAPGDLRGSGTVLVIDDEEAVRQAAKASLERFGYAVILAGNALEGLHAFEQASDAIHMVVLDMTMPVLGGEETARSIHRLCPGVPIIGSSGYPEAESMARFADCRLAGFIRKPYTSVELAQKVKAFFRAGVL